MPRYTKAEREEAARICAIGASDIPHTFAQDHYIYIARKDKRCDQRSRAENLFWKAWSIAERALPGEDAGSPLLDAEAEALIRNMEI